MRLGDPSASRIALIGTATYARSGGLPDVPAVANNLRALREIFTDPELGAMPGEHVPTLLDAQVPAEVDEWLEGIARSSGDLLLVYYSGHGLIGDDEELYFTVGGSDIDHIHRTGVPFAWIKRAILDSPARTRVLILDCCHSGQAMVRLGRLGGGVSAVLHQVDIEGTYVLTASGPSQAARALDGQEFTAFTDVLVQLLRGGVNGGPELLTSSYLFPRLSQALARAGLPKPHQQTKDMAGQLALVRNAAFVHGTAPDLRLPGTHEPVRTDTIVPPADYVPAADSLRELRDRSPQFVPRHYDRLAAAYSDEGYEADAETVLMAKERRRYEARAAHRPLGAIALRLWSWIQRTTVGYGYRPTRLLVWLILPTVAGTTWFDSHIASPINADDPQAWNPSLITVDLLLPIIDLGQVGVWHFEPASIWIASALSVYGWMMTAAVLACLPRVLRRR
ncbi:caspase family protein [Saccharothrix deserti]|uniref:caspase family protein n=1 Tax=Saccharothrix deserti TaxID=2593674 RepID=UPI00131AC4C1|nr:caspase family protein [Saccharothrix deserti]